MTSVIESIKSVKNPFTNNEEEQQDEGGDTQNFFSEVRGSSLSTDNSLH